MYVHAFFTSAYRAPVGKHLYCGVCRRYGRNSWHGKQLEWNCWQGTCCPISLISKAVMQVRTSNIVINGVRISITEQHLVHIPIMDWLAQGVHLVIVFLLCSSAGFSSWMVPYAWKWELKCPTEHVESTRHIASCSVLRTLYSCKIIHCVSGRIFFTTRHVCDAVRLNDQWGIT